MNSEFRRFVDQLPGLLKSLKGSRLISRSDLTGIPEMGVYVFLEKGKPMYVGRTDDMKGRIQRHSRPSSGHGSATFAFLIAKKAAGGKGIDLDVSREVLEKDPAFVPLFNKAKERVRTMPVKVIRIDDAILQTLFEVYAAVALETTEYNSFVNH